MVKYLLVPETKHTEKMSHMLWGLLGQLGIFREECEVLPLLGDDKPRGSYQRINADQMAEVLPAFRERLAAAEAEVLIPMGGTVFRAITGLGKGWGINNIAGYVILAEDCVPIPMRQEVQIGVYKANSKARPADKQKGCPRFAMRKIPQDPVLPKGCRWIIPSIAVTALHPQRFKNVTQFRSAFSNAKRLLAGEPLLDESFVWEDRLPPAALDDDEWLSYDLETPFETTDIDRASISSSQGTWTFPWTAEAADAVRTLLCDAGMCIAHNQQFDIPILAAHGIEVPQPHFDSMLCATLLEPDLLKGLDSVAPRYLLLRPWKHLAQTRGFADPEYSAKDAFVERHLALAMQEQLEEAKMSGLFHNVMMPAVPELQDMRLQGIKLDVATTAEWCEGLETQLGECMQRWVARHPDISPTSPHQLKRLLYHEWKLPIQRRKGDGISTDELALRVLSKKAPKHADDLNLLLEIREASKLLGTYAKGVLGMDRVHPSYLPASKDTTDARSGKGLAATGRITSSKPNIQNQPPEARIMYIPDRPDMCFVEMDWSQAELRIAAALSGDEVMQAALDSEGGIHERTMEMLDCDKTRAKNVTFGSAYGAAPKKLVETLAKEGYETTIDEMRSLQLRLARSYPRWWAWRWSIMELAKSQQWLRNPFGRVRFFRDKGDGPAALDYLPQSVVADMMWTCVPEVGAMCRQLDGRLTTVVHDSYLLQVPAENVSESVRRGQDILQQPFDCVDPGWFCPVSVKVGAPGASWSELQEYEKSPH